MPNYTRYKNKINMHESHSKIILTHQIAILYVYPLIRH